MGCIKSKTLEGSEERDLDGKYNKTPSSIIPETMQDSRVSAKKDIQKPLKETSSSALIDHTREDGTNSSTGQNNQENTEVNYLSMGKTGKTDSLIENTKCDTYETDEMNENVNLERHVLKEIVMDEITFEEDPVSKDIGIMSENGHNDQKKEFKRDLAQEEKEMHVHELPANLPGPAPPKTKKKDLITDTTFTRVDALLDKVDVEAEKSIPRLGLFLSGKFKQEDFKSLDHEEAPALKLPKVAPPKITKKTLMSDPDMFKHVDEYSKTVPESVRYSVDKLAEYLSTVARNDMEKTRAFYYWICHNINTPGGLNKIWYSFDKGSEIPERLKHDAASTLRQGQGNCVSVMKALCSAVGIPVVTIIGCSKGLRTDSDRDFLPGERNHSWNAVYVNHEWRFVDCTWGSGYLDETGKFHQQYDDFWFFTDPEIFIYDHFPDHPLWQLLDDPIDIYEFNKKPCLTKRSKELGLLLISHREPIIYFDKEIHIEIATETLPLSNITSDLRDSNNKDINEHRCMERLDASRFQIRVVPPHSGEYRLSLYGQSKEYKHAKFRRLMEYILRCAVPYADPITFPKHYKVWGPEPNFDDLGFEKSILKHSVFSTDFLQMAVPLDLKREIIVNAEMKGHTNVEKDLSGNIFLAASKKRRTVFVRFPGRGYYKLDIYAEGNVKEDTLEFVAAFLLECQSNDVNERLFPKYNPEAVSKFQATLTEPLERELPENTELDFCVTSTNRFKKLILAVPFEANDEERLKPIGELKLKEENDVCTYRGRFVTPKKGTSLFLAGSAAPPNVFMTRIFEFITF
ncbi:hypothetical protein CHS0354_035016 [Potamilus streckersoni]|uniref:Transglutaminase-like domain-containing protein n=1 Tax=Potamilus streckersoni TaxID=2493646 RepID=A0AAE0SEJ1_9BIVA|nr:hypothetical protein CHS0354_035016 [Potamilus streckersoni]